MPMPCWWRVMWMPTSLPSVPYLRDREALGTELVVAATVHVEPLGIYSKKFKHLREVPEKAVIALPNNVTNLSRASICCSTRGLITLKAGHEDPARDLATVRIATNPKALRITEIEAPQLPRSLDDVDLAVINGGYALEAGLEPARDALGLEGAEQSLRQHPGDHPGAQDDPRIRQLARDHRVQGVADFIRQRATKGVGDPGGRAAVMIVLEGSASSTRGTGNPLWRVARDSGWGHLRHSRGAAARAEHAHSLPQSAGAAKPGPHPVRWPRHHGPGGAALRRHRQGPA